MQDIAEFVKNTKPNTAHDYIAAYGIGNYVVFDTETSLLKDRQNIYVDRPEFVLAVVERGNVVSSHWNLVSANKEIIYSIDNCHIIVGHNLPFDLNAVQTNYISTDSLLWDTALFDYIAFGQKYKFPSLEDTAVRWAVPESLSRLTKLSKVSEAIKAGVQPKDIDQQDLYEYCLQDVKLTLSIFKSQFDYFSKQSRKYKEMIVNQMNWLRTIYNMSVVGITLDMPRISASIKSMSEIEEKLTKECNEYLEKWIMSNAPKGFIPLNTINCMSNQQLEIALFGGEVKGYFMEDTGEVYKTGSKAGTPKYKKEPYSVLVTQSIWPPNIKRGSVDSKNLQEMNKYLSKGDTSDFIDKILELRDVSKTKNTYFIGYSDYADVSNKIHSEFKHVGTPTGRLSSTKPNIQNLKGDE